MSSALLAHAVLEDLLVGLLSSPPVSTVLRHLSKCLVLLDAIDVEGAALAYEELFRRRNALSHDAVTSEECRLIDTLLSNVWTETDCSNAVDAVLQSRFFRDASSPSTYPPAPSSATISPEATAVTAATSTTSPAVTAVTAEALLAAFLGVDESDLPDPCFGEALPVCRHRSRENNAVAASVASSRDEASIQKPLPRGRYSLDEAVQRCETRVLVSLLRMFMLGTVLKDTSLFLTVSPTPEEQEQMRQKGKEGSNEKGFMTTASTSCKDELEYKAKSEPSAKSIPATVLISDFSAVTSLLKTSSNLPSVSADDSATVTTAADGMSSLDKALRGLRLRLEVGTALSDLDPKPVVKIPAYGRLDRRIVTHYVAHADLHLFNNHLVLKQ